MNVSKLTFGSMSTLVGKEIDKAMKNTSSNNSGITEIHVVWRAYYYPQSLSPFHKFRVVKQTQMSLILEATKLRRKNTVFFVLACFLKQLTDNWAIVDLWIFFQINVSFA